MPFALLRNSSNVIAICCNHCNFFQLVAKHTLQSSLNKVDKCSPAPRHLIHKIFEPMVSVDGSFTPEVEYSRKLGVSRAKLSFRWPAKFHVFGKASTDSEALENAYHSACRAFMCTGIVTSNGQLVNLNEKMHQYEQNWRLQSGPLGGGLKTMLEHVPVNDLPHWKAFVSLPGHFGFQVTGFGASKKLALKHAYMNAVVKMTVCRRSKPQVIRLPLACDSCVPDYEFFVDASRLGFGAYLIDNTQEATGSVRWLQEKWSAEILASYVHQRPHPSLLEFYALVATVFTWKKRFQGRHVLVWSDSANCVELITYGLRINNTHFFKLYQLLNSTCTTYNICLRAQHVVRTCNVAADCLARSNIDQFRTMISNTCNKSKKSKQLNFCFPLITDKRRPVLVAAASALSEN